MLQKLDANIVFTKQKKNLFGTPLAPSVDDSYAVDGTYGLAVMRCWCVAMTDVTLVSVFVPYYINP